MHNYNNYPPPRKNHLLEKQRLLDIGTLKIALAMGIGGFILAIASSIVLGIYFGLELAASNNDYIQFVGLGLAVVGLAISITALILAVKKLKALPSLGIPSIILSILGIVNSAIALFIGLVLMVEFLANI